MNQHLKQNQTQGADQASSAPKSTLAAPAESAPAESTDSTIKSASVQAAMAEGMAAFEGAESEQAETSTGSTREPLDSKTMATNGVERFFSGEAQNHLVAQTWAKGQAEGTGPSDFYKLPAEDRKAFTATFFAEAAGADLKKESTSPFAHQQVKRAYLDAQRCSANAERQIKKSGVEDVAIIQSAMQGATSASLAISYYEQNGFGKYGTERHASSGKFPASFDGGKALDGLKRGIEKTTWTPEVKANALANVEWFGKALDAANASGNQRAAAAIAGTVIALEAAQWVKRPFAKPQTLGAIRSHFRQAGAETPEAFGEALAAKMDTAKYDSSKDNADWIKPNATYGMRQLFFKDGIHAPGAKAPDAQTQEV